MLPESMPCRAHKLLKNHQHITIQNCTKFATNIRKGVSQPCFYGLNVLPYNN